MQFCSTLANISYRCPVITCINVYLHAREKKVMLCNGIHSQTCSSVGSGSGAPCTFALRLRTPVRNRSRPVLKKIIFAVALGLGRKRLASIHHQPGTGEVGVADRLATRSGAVHSSAESLYGLFKLITQTC